MGILFTLCYEKRWACWMVHANRVTDAGEYYGIVGRYTPGVEEPEGTEREVVAWCRKYDMPELFYQFGRRLYKNEREFLLNVADDYRDKSIRPYIEKYVVKALDGIVAGGFPLFLQLNRLDNYYKNESLRMMPGEMSVSLKFRRTGEAIHYTLLLTDGVDEWIPCEFQLKMVSRQPCRVVMGKRLVVFGDDFDGQRLLPFLTKREIIIPKSHENEYFRKFILKNVYREEIEVDGFEVITREVERVAVLSLEREVLPGPLLSLVFYYGEKKILAGASRDTIVELKAEGDSYVFYKTHRDLAWESAVRASLIALGVVEREVGFFKLSEENREGMNAGDDDWGLAVDWLRTRARELQERGIHVSQENLLEKFYTGEWSLCKSVSTENDWFNLKVEVRLSDGRVIPFTRFRKYILSGNRKFVLDDHTVFLIPEEWFARYSDLLLFSRESGERLLLNRNRYALLAREEAGIMPVAAPRWSGVAELPTGFHVALRPYQREGYAWLYALYRDGFGGCLADDMGLGKTVQTIGMLLKYKQESVHVDSCPVVVERGTQLSLFDVMDEAGNGESGSLASLVVVPASLVYNWKNELQRFAPGLKVLVYAGENRSLSSMDVRHADVILMTYHTLRNDIGRLSRFSFGFIVADEAQVLKNPSSRLHQAMLQLQGRYFLALSGTPVENSLNDLWAVMHLVNRDLLGTSTFFRDHFTSMRVTDPKDARWTTLRNLIAPFVLRRTKEEVLRELPERTDELIRCEPDEEQAVYYEREQARVRNYILEKRERQEGLHGDFVVLQALTRLRQIADHPSLVDPDYGGESGKFKELFRMLEELVGTGHKVLIFSSFVKYLRLVAVEVERLGWKYAMLTGETRDREREIASFSGEEDCRLFLISLKAGGVGLNLTEADYVFILDPWWNPAVEEQAISRSHRMGQKRCVFVYRFILVGTLEEKMMQIQKRKQELANTVLARGEGEVPGDDELLELVSLEK